MAICILNAEPEGYCEEARQILGTLGKIIEKPLTQEQLTLWISGVDVLIVRLGLRIDHQALRNADHLRFIVTATTGLDHIDLDAASERDIVVLSLQGEQDFLRTVPATAEHSWALLLALIRKLPWAFDSVRGGKWERDAFRGRDLQGMRLGLLGLGRIGTIVASYGLTFGMQVGAYDPYCGTWVAGVEKFDNLAEMLRWSEVLSVHVPLNNDTRHLLTRDRLRLLPRGSMIINTSRGGIVDETALLDLLQAGHLGGAALDVLSEELSIEGGIQSPLLAYAQSSENLLITPHLGGATWDSMRRTEIFMAKKLQRFLKNEERFGG